MFLLGDLPLAIKRAQDTGTDIAISYVSKCICTRDSDTELTRRADKDGGLAPKPNWHFPQ